MSKKILLIGIVFFILIIYPYWLPYNYVGSEYMFFIGLIGFVVFAKMLGK